MIRYFTSNSVFKILAALSISFSSLNLKPAAASASLLAAKPPGVQDLLPQWALGQGRTHSRDVFRQAERVAYGTQPAGAGGQASLLGLRRRQGWLGDAVPNLGAQTKTPGPTKAPAAKPKSKAKAKAKAN